MIQSLLHAFFPEVCLVCKRLLFEKEKHICLHCLYALPRTGFLHRKENELFMKLANRFPLESAQALFFFNKNNNSQKLLHGIKYHPQANHANWFGGLMGEAWQESGRRCPDVLVPVPLHKKRQKERGYNQSEALANGFASVTKAEVLPEALCRNIYQDSQTRKGKTERWMAAEAVYTKNVNVDLKGKSVLLMDDVITTGSTIEACSQALFAMEIKELHVYSLSMAL
jgi:ComF family protein